MKRILRAILSMTLVLVLGFGAIAILTQLSEGDESNIASQEVETTTNDPLAFSDSFTAEDCLPSEQFDAETNSCFYECDTDAECAELEAQLDQELAALYDEEASQTFATHGDEFDTNADITTYEIEGTTIVSESGASIPAADQEVWDLFTQIAPSAFIDDNLATFETYADIDDSTMASVAPLPNQPNKWSLRVNIDSTHRDGNLLRDEAVHTLIHEFAHILTLEADQVPPAVWENSTEESCETFFTGEGCADEESYIYEFFTKYWADIYSQLPVEGAEDDTFAFYEQYQDRFLNDYAATNPGEDIAESFTAFVLRPRSSGSAVSDQKVNFFYDYPELVTLRSQIRNRISR